MAWSEKLKLNKQLVRTLTEEGLTGPKEIQLRTLVRISGGQDLVVIAPEGSGKTTTCIMSALNKFRQGYEDAPRVLMLVPDKERVLSVLEAFEKINKNKSIRITGLFAAPGFEAQLDALAEGVDIVVATPDRARAIYLKLALDLNKIQLFILDDADLIVKQGLQLPVAELANSIIKCQRLVFTEVSHPKLEKMIQPFMREPAVVEIELDAEPALITYEQLLYQVPNFKTKLNLLNLFLEDAELFTKVIVLVNTPLTADKIFKDLRAAVKREAMLYKQHNAEAVTVTDINQFITGNGRILIALNSTIESADIDAIPFVIHFELPEDKDVYISRIVNEHPDEEFEKIVIALVTDLELNQVRKIEQATGVRIPLSELPQELKIEAEQADRTKKKPAEEDPLKGAAFHAKKPSNAKTTNFKATEKAKMNRRKKHS